MEQFTLERLPGLANGLYGAQEMAGVLVYAPRGHEGERLALDWQADVKKKEQLFELYAAEPLYQDELRALLPQFEPVRWAAERSCGAVVARRGIGGPEHLLIQSSRSGDIGFPKGHVEPGEALRQTAVREIAEETGLNVTLLDGFHEESRYALGGGVKKVVHYFAGVADGALRPQQEEVSGLWFLPLNEALRRLTHESDRALLTKAHAFLSDRLPYA